MYMKITDHKYTLSLYTKVDEYLADNQQDRDNIADIIVSFCIVIEKTLKLKLYEKNPVLVFDLTRFKNNNSLVAVITKQDVDIETIKIFDVIERFRILHPKIFSDEELQILLDIYFVRNDLVHGYKEDSKILSDIENLIKKMGTIWEKLSGQAIVLFGKDNIKQSIPKKKYTEEELENILVGEVKKKIQPKEDSFGMHGYLHNPYSNIDFSPYITSSFSEEKCPRCGLYGFSLDSKQDNLDSFVTVTSTIFGVYSNLYKCRKCNLELTKKEYEIAKKIKRKND